MSWRIILALIVPVVVSLAMMLVFAGRYSRSLERMEAIAALKPMVTDAIPGAVWRAGGAGRKPRLVDDRSCE